MQYEHWLLAGKSKTCPLAGENWTKKQEQSDIGFCTEIDHK